MVSLTSTYTVKGMTCDGCVRKVSSAVAGVPGVTDVDADAATGEVTVTSDAALSVVDVRTAIQEAGYEVVA